MARPPLPRHRRSGVRSVGPDPPSVAARQSSDASIYGRANRIVPHGSLHLFHLNRRPDHGPHRTPSLRDYGLPLHSAFSKNFWVGTAAGFLAISSALFCIFLFHGFRLTGVATHGNTLIFATLVWTAVFIVVGLSEEFAFRGYLQFTLTTGMGFWPSAFLLSVLFGLAHAGNPGESKFGLVSVVFFGLLFCLFLRRTGNLWWAVGFHAGWDWGETFFYGVADSGIPAYHNLFNSEFAGRTWITGGSVGPEASVFTPIVLAIVAILFSRVYGRQIGKFN